jgi:hypothetical protein
MNSPERTFNCRTSSFACALSIAIMLSGVAWAQAQAVVFANLQRTAGIETDRAGNVYVDSDGIFTTLITKFAPSGTALLQTTLGGITVGNLGHMVRVPNSDNMLLLTSRGSIYLFGPTLQLRPYLDFTSLNFQVANGVYDVTTGGFRSLVLGAPTWGDIAAFWPSTDVLSLYISATTGASGGFPFILRVDLDFRLSRILWRVIVTSTGTTAGTVNQPRGIAVNAAGWVLTGFPFLIPNLGFGESLVAFRTSFPETQTADVAPRFVLQTTRTRTGLHDVASVGMTADAAGNFYVASGVVGSSLCGFGGSSALVLINPVPTNPNPRCLVLPSILTSSNDVAVSPVGAIPYITVGNQVLRFDPLIRAASTASAEAAVPQVQGRISTRRLLELQNAPLEENEPLEED